MNKYLLLPKEFRNKHELCMHLLTQIEDLIINDKFQSLWVKKIFLTEEIEIPDNLLDYLKNKNLIDEYDEIITLSIIRGLLSDFCYFTQEALGIALKQRLSVSLSLIRKPFVYNLVVLLRVIYDSDFIERFKNDSSYDPAKIKKEDRINLFNAALNHILIQPFSAQELDNWIFNRELSDSIINISEKALHLTTNRNANNLTGTENFNFIFSNAENIYSQYEYIYNRLPALLLFTVQVTDVILIQDETLAEKYLEQRLNQRIGFMTKYQHT